MSGSWRPLLTGAQADQARAAVDDIAAALSGIPIDAFQQTVAEVYTDRSDEVPVTEQSARYKDASLAGGTAGIALFFAYLAAATERDEHAEHAAEFLDAAVDAVAEHPMSSGLYGGYPGVAFVVEHLNKHFFEVDPAIEEEDVNEAIDEAVLKMLRAGPEPGDYDLISGLVGMGVYALERLPRPSARTCLDTIVEYLEQWAERFDAGKTWFTPAQFLPAWQRAFAPDGYYNLGLAHGVPGVIGLLSEIVAAAPAPNTRALLTEAVTWLQQQRLPAAMDGTFATTICAGCARTPARSAWCYGDPGAASALFVAARAARNAEWEREAIAIAKKSARRRPENAGVKDAAICHGAAGLGHIFNRFYQATSEPEFATAARFWLQRTLDMRRSGEGVGGFAAFAPDPDGTERWLDDVGFLAGAAGIGLVLLAALEPREPGWDRVLLTSLPNTESR